MREHMTMKQADRVKRFRDEGHIFQFLDIESEVKSAPEPDLHTDTEDDQDDGRTD